MPGYTVSCNIVKMLKYVCLFFLKQIARKKYSMIFDIYLRHKKLVWCALPISNYSMHCHVKCFKYHWLLSGSWHKGAHHLHYPIACLHVPSCYMHLWFEHQLVVCVSLCQLVHLLWIRLIGRLVQNRLKHSQLWSFYVCIFSFLGPCICCVHTVEWFLLTIISYHT